MGNEITNEEVVELIQRCRNKDLEAGNILYKNYFNLVENIICNRASNSNYDYGFLLKIGREGLKEAIASFDLTNKNFREYTIRYVTNKVDDFIKKNPVPIFSIDKLNKVKKIVVDLKLNIKSDELLELRYTLEKLPKNVKRFLALKYDNVSYEEIALKLDTNIESLNNAFDKVTNNLKVKFGVTNHTIFDEEVANLLKSEETKKIEEPVKIEVNKVMEVKKEPVYEAFKTPSYTITEYVNSDDITLIKEVIEHDLAVKQRVIIYKRFGKNLDENNEVDSALERGLLGIALEKINNTIKYKNDKKFFAKGSVDTTKDIYSYLPNRSLDEIKYIINLAKLTAEEKRGLYVRFGPDLDKVNPLKDSDRNVFAKAIRKLQEIDLSLDVDINSLINDDLDKISAKMLDLLSSYDKQELLIFILRMHLIPNNNYTLSELSAYFNMSEEEINIVCKKIMLSLNNNFRQLIMLSRDLFAKESTTINISKHL